MNRKYDPQDFALIIQRKKTKEEIANKYGVSVEKIQKQMNRQGYYLSKRRIIIISPYQLTECDSVNSAAKQLGVSHTSILKALKGERVRILEELGITLKEEKPNEDIT